MKFMISCQPPPASVFLAAGLGTVAKFMSGPSSTCPPQANHMPDSGFQGQNTSPLATFCSITFRLCPQDAYETDCRAPRGPTASCEKSRLHAQLPNSTTRHTLPTLTRLIVLRLRGWRANIREGADTVWLSSEACVVDAQKLAVTEGPAAQSPSPSLRWRRHLASL